MPKFYFTYGLDPVHPYQGGWTEVTAPDERMARNLFRMFHPDKEGRFGTLNCADIYTEAQFIATDMFLNGNFGAWCQEEIGLIHNLIAEKEGNHETA